MNKTSVLLKLQLSDFIKNLSKTILIILIGGIILAILGSLIPSIEFNLSLDNIESVYSILAACIQLLMVIITALYCILNIFNYYPLFTKLGYTKRATSISRILFLLIISIIGGLIVSLLLNIGIDNIIDTANLNILDRVTTIIPSFMVICSLFTIVALVVYKLKWNSIIVLIILGQLDEVIDLTNFDLISIINDNGLIKFLIAIGILLIVNIITHFVLLKTNYK